jgi:hypothetical protein
MNQTPMNTEHLVSTERLIALELRKEIASRAEFLTEQAEQLLNTVGKTDLTNAQINGLMTVTNTTDKATDVRLFLERQASRRKPWEQYAPALIEKIDKVLRGEAQVVAEAVEQRLRSEYDRNDEKVDALTQGRRNRVPEIHLLLVRELIQSFGIGYLYRMSREDF